jgi:hypothetical protein
MDIQDLWNKTDEEETNPSARPTKSPLVSLKSDLDFYKEAIKEVAQDILDAQLSEYPVFIAHQHSVQLGELILDREELERQWSIHACTLEDLVEASVILPGKKQHFMRQFKDPSQYMCLLVMVPQGANFVFYPYENAS